ncbi:thiamine diphosphokinase [Limosilactobacillus sp.]|jgi:thiamine pyrophosphokinase|uniref:thiamine diphosphokinase n=1 Tax=Limosilactobacillus sp. TaxID=2773925 RepID=UPI0025C505A1|nr:thiamine diphosphokinase [Limosilactobacillus sp.]MCH3923030.1 thiamine diphosphokinase [Limosilactobacillus sp.]MCH3927713.1 thiamine diphosphokinase [Limosilactobacillus sp.]
MRVNIMVGGPTDLIPKDQVLKRQNETWIGVDHGASLLMDWGICPAAAIGDFDSTARTEMDRLRERVAEIRTFPPAKDFTDTQLGVATAIRDYQPDQIDIWGATGGRLDQLLANLYLPLQEDFYSYLPKIRLIDNENIVRYFLPGTYSIYEEPGLDYLAFVSLTPVRGLTLPDEKYPLVNWNGTIPFSWSSNRFTSIVNHFSFDRGIVAVIWSADLHD